MGVFDRSTYDLRYTSCGHEHPIILRGDEYSEGKTSGPPLGAVATVKYVEEIVHIDVGDIIVLYTDGLSEAGPDRRRLLGFDGLAEIVRQNSKPTAWDREEGNGHPKSLSIAGNVMSDVLSFANGQLRDDACLIVLQRTDTASLDERDETRLDRGVLSQPHDYRPGDIQPVLNGLVTDRPAEDQLRLLIENVSEYAIFLLDVKGNIVTWNKGAERIEGYRAEEIVGKHFSIFYTPEDVQRGHPLDELAIAVSEGRYEEEGWRVRKDGTRFWANVIITALFDSHGNLCGFGKVTRDFTARRRAEEQLRRSEERFRLLVQGVRDYAIFMLDVDGNVVSWNDGAQSINGYQAHEIIGQHFSRFYTPEDIARDHPTHELEIARAEGRYQEEGWRVRKDGSRFWANVLITALREQNGALYGYAKVTRDVSERRATQEAHEKILRDQISRSFLRDILYSVTEGRLRFCESDDQLPAKHVCHVDNRPFGPDALAVLRQDIAEAGRDFCLPQPRVLDITTAASEAAMNAVVHATNAEYSICGRPGLLQVWLVDHGAGIEINQLHRATLERGFSTDNSLGHGFWLMLHTCDRVWLRSTESGTTIVLEQESEAQEPDWLSHPRGLSNYLSRANDFEE